MLDRLLSAVRSGESRTLVVRGEAGVGKTVLLEYLAERAAGCQVVRVVGVQSEMELAFAGLHWLCAPVLHYLGRLPAPQQDALRTSFGIKPSDARALLDSVLTGPLEARVRDQIVAETRGNPLALLELPRGLSPAELAGFRPPEAMQLPVRIEESFQRQLDALPSATRRLLQLAAADPTGDPALVWQAAGRLAACP